MILDGRSVVDHKYVTFDEQHVVDTENQVQPNGVDLRVGKIYSVITHGQIPQEGKAIANGGATPLVSKNNWWDLNPKQTYFVDFLEEAHIPPRYCAKLVARSSLIRCGVDIMAGLYDTGWNGRIGCTLRVHMPIKIEWGAKLCQIMFFESVFRGDVYTGRYQGQDSQAALFS